MLHISTPWKPVDPLCNGVPSSLQGSRSTSYCGLYDVVVINIKLGANLISLQFIFLECPAQLRMFEQVK
jgi:hypothetical protein